MSDRFTLKKLRLHSSGVLQIRGAVSRVSSLSPEQITPDLMKVSEREEEEVSSSSISPLMQDFLQEMSLGRREMLASEGKKRDRQRERERKKHTNKIKNRPSQESLRSCRQALLPVVAVELLSAR
ncbi:hypothetical protein JZ751_023909 [Albula glossodonta]|uniref:Uncharacterized protein n=1 Tax=Albula glossodonta TaxID=121402 RepID=A0A8T2NFS6_9TELE|nr:hypothetical protein JZ751_023909 [Albula glossodonta]